MYADIHSHIVPGIDDGAQDIDTARQMMEIAASGGTSQIITTPHFIFGHTQITYDWIVEKCNELQLLAMQNEINLAIHPGCEVFICPEVPELYDKGAVGTLANSRYILIELPMLSFPAYTDQVLYDLQLKGLVPVIAHPERNEQIIEHPEILLDMINRGMLAQANVGSITGLFGRKVRKAALKFIEAGLVQFVASDAHSTGRRSPKLSIAAKQIARSYGDELAKALFINNGVLLILNEQIPVHINWKTKKKRLSRLFESKNEDITNREP